MRKKNLMLRWNCISLWDYAAAAPYVDITMNGQTPKDAIYFSGHKFVGGIQTPGILQRVCLTLTSECVKYDCWVSCLQVIGVRSKELDKSGRKDGDFSLPIKGVSMDFSL